MPLGFAKSVLTSQYSTGTTRDGAMRAFTNDGVASNTGNFTLNKAATYTVSHSTAPFSNSAVFSAVFWVRIKQQNGNIADPATRFVYMTDADQSDFWGLVIGNGSNISYMNIFNSSGNKLSEPYGHTYTAGGDGSGGKDNPAFITALCDGAWHCVMISIDGANQTATYFLDGSTQNEGLYTGAALSGTVNSSDFKNIALRNNNGGHNTNYNSGSFETGPDFHLGPIWLYDSYIDFTNSTNRGYFYKSTNTDGFVDGGTDGTDGGAPTPDVYMYHDASTLQVSSAQTPTVNLVTHNSGAIVVVPSSEGPGSGDTI